MMADPTSYIVLYAATNGWESLGTTAAGSAEAAIKARLAQLDNVLAGTYVAVPTRSWKPVKVSAVQTTVLKLENAEPS